MINTQQKITVMVQKTHIFNQSLSVGLVGEELVANYFEQKEYIVVKISLRQEKKYHYDFLCTKTDYVSIDNEYEIARTVTHLIEVKTEPAAEKTGNLFFEDEVENSTGWIHHYSPKSKIKICWVLPDSKKLYFFHAKNLLKIPYKDFPKKEILNKTYKAWGYLVPLSYIKPLCKEIVLDKIDESMNK